MVASGLVRRVTVAKVFQSPQALQDLDEIWFFIAQDNLSAADRWLDILLEKAVKLAERPHLGRARPDLLPEIRSLPVKAYMLYYRQVTGGIELVRVLHSSRDIESEFPPVGD